MLSSLSDALRTFVSATPKAGLAVRPPGSGAPLPEPGSVVTTPVVERVPEVDVPDGAQRAARFVAGTARRNGTSTALAAPRERTWVAPIPPSDVDRVAQLLRTADATAVVRRVDARLSTALGPVGAEAVMEAVRASRDPSAGLALLADITGVAGLGGELASAMPPAVIANIADIMDCYLRILDSPDGDLDGDVRLLSALASGSSGLADLDDAPTLAAGITAFMADDGDTVVRAAQLEAVLRLDAGALRAPEKVRAELVACDALAAEFVGIDTEQGRRDRGYLSAAARCLLNAHPPNAVRGLFAQAFAATRDGAPVLIVAVLAHVYDAPRVHSDAQWAKAPRAAEELSREIHRFARFFDAIEQRERARGVQRGALRALRRGTFTAVMAEELCGASDQLFSALMQLLLQHSRLARPGSLRRLRSAVRGARRSLAEPETASMGQWREAICRIAPGLSR